MAVANTPRDQYEYYILFTGRFRNDVISLSINNKSICTNYTIENTNPNKKGHFSIVQNENKISIAYNGKRITKAKVPVNFQLDLTITINGSKKNFTVDLKKGKVILVDFQTENDQSIQKDLTIEQVQEPVILF